MENFQMIIIVLSLASAVLAWVAKLKWSKEFRLAKDAQITALKEQVKAKESELNSFKGQLETKDELINIKQSQIDHLNNLNPTTLTEYHDKVKKGLESYIEELKTELESIKYLLDQKDSQINTLGKTSDHNKTRIKKLSEERKALVGQIETLERRINQQTDTLVAKEKFEESTFWKTIVTSFFEDHKTYSSLPSTIIKPVDTLSNIRNKTNFIWAGLTEVKSPTDIVEEEILEKTYINVKKDLSRLQDSGYLSFSVKFSQNQTETGENVHLIRIENISTILINYIKKIESAPLT